MLDASDIVRIVDAIRNRDFSALPPGDDPVSAALRALGESLRDDARAALDRTVRFSINASEAMTAVSQMSTNLHETDSRTQTMA
jgi:hypothetical protein